MSLYERIGIVGYHALKPVMSVFLNRTSRVYVVLIHEGRILLVRNWLSKGNWRLPGGGIGKNEDIKAAAAREIHEELGVAIEPSSLMDLIAQSRYNGDGVKYRYRVLACHLPKLPQIRSNKLEITAYDWFDNVDSLDKWPVIDEVMKLLKMRNLI